MLQSVGFKPLLARSCNLQDPVQGMQISGMWISVA
jgi:hypothetical protein